MKGKVKIKLNITVQNITSEVLKKLAGFESDDLALSFYLSSQIGREPWGKIKTEISSIEAEGRKLINEATIEKRKKAELLDKLGKITEYLNTFEIPREVKTLAVFIGREEAQIITLPFFVDRDIKLKRIFNLKHLIEALSRKDLYAVLLAERTGGRIMVIDKGEIIEASEIIHDDVPRKTKSGEEERSGFGTGGARSHDLRSKRIDRHIEWHLEQHIEKIACDLFSHFWRKYKFKYLLVDSHEDLKGKIEKELHPYLKPELKIFWHMRPDENLDDVRKKGEEYFEKIQRDEDENIVKRLIEEIGRPSVGVSGVDETLDQLNKGTLGVIYISENLKTDGYYTKEAGDLTVYSAKDFLKGGEKIFTLDLTDAICRKAILTKTKVRFMDNSDLDKLGGLAGIFEKY